MTHAYKIEQSSDIVVLDHEHHHLGTLLVNFFTDIQTENLSMDGILEPFNELIMDINQHFSHEEKIMRNIALPSYDQHYEQHLRLMRDIEEYRKVLSDHVSQEELQYFFDYMLKFLFRQIEIENQLIYEHLHRDQGATPDVVNEEYVTQCFRHDSLQPIILIVDDEPVNIHLLATMLKSDYQVLFALSGEDALRIAELNEPDLILLDIKMQGMDGFSVCARLKTHPRLKDIPIIFVTALHEVHDEAQGLDIGAIDYIIKPINKVIVRHRIHNHLKLKIQRDTLRRFAVIDGLTGIANRRGFEDAFEREWRRSRRNHSPLAIIIADIDHFKAYNDFYGHLAGDECLRAVAEVLRRRMTRPGDLAARYGGEELVCLLPDTDVVNAHQIAQYIFTDLATLAVRHEASPVAAVVTISAGIASAISDGVTDRNELLALADIHLYEAKNSGRNRINA